MMITNTDFTKGAKKFAESKKIALHIVRPNFDHTFDYVIANPMWNQKEYNDTFYSNDRWKRFTYGVAPSSSADWAWVQHMLASLKGTGRAAIVLDTGAVSRGSGNKSSNRERDIRKKFVENDLIEGRDTPA